MFSVRQRQAYQRLTRAHERYEVRWGDLPFSVVLLHPSQFSACAKLLDAATDAPLTQEAICAALDIQMPPAGALY